MSDFNQYLITLDVDWAPDWCIEYVSKILIDKKIKATWFITHDSPAIKKILNHPDLFELGIHPNFHANSTQGNNPREVMKTLMSIIPSAVSVRTHGLVQSTPLLKMMREEFNLKYDISILLYKCANISPHVIYTPEKKSIIRIPFFWEDDLEMFNPRPDFSFKSEKYPNHGLKIFNFHPIHIYLNSSSLELYNACKEKKLKLADLTAECADAFKNYDHGTLTMFNEMTDYLQQCEHRGATISEIGNAFHLISGEI